MKRQKEIQGTVETVIEYLKMDNANNLVKKMQDVLEYISIPIEPQVGIASDIEDTKAFYETLYIQLTHNWKYRDGVKSVSLNEIKEVFEKLGLTIL